MKKHGPAVLVAIMSAWCTPSAYGLSLSPLSPNELCARVDNQIAALSNIVMREEISRYESIHGRKSKIDEFDASVEMSDGVDTVESIRHNGRTYSSAQIPGAWAFGDFSAVLRISREALDCQSVRLLHGLGSEPDVLVAAFHYPASSGRWYVKLGSHTWWLDFQGEIRMSATTGDVLDISWTSAPLAAGADIRQVQRTVRFAPAEAGGEMWVLPEYAEYRVIHSNDRVEWNTTRFYDPARYGSLSSVKFGD
ncbi:MAG TPA: hypothetical protein VK789_10675 [Bryobacteraceae bacterium]|nr:hypothetical protein [Bryobacteraceae bacterium]